MAALDKFHGTVKQALIKDGWSITNDPLQLQYGGIDFFIDLAAERLITAEKSNQKIAVEVKSFLSDSVTYEFHTAVGQCINYKIILKELQPERVLYLAVPSEIYHSFFEGQFAQMVISQTAIKIIVYDCEKEVIEKWIN
ncbi:fatty-acid oxidation protein subunit alpha [Candidatus Magnetomorum sp. HK-1]|nr:fatty-acid oxidation protein subunit alpha [Candidatus Magnetomorum sp. HK-1]